MKRLRGPYKLGKLLPGGRRILRGPNGGGRRRGRGACRRYRLRLFFIGGAEGGRTTDLSTNSRDSIGLSVDEILSIIVLEIISLEFKKKSY